MASTIGPTAALLTVVSAEQNQHSGEEAITFFTESLRFTVVEDSPLGNGKRWGRRRLPGGGTALLLARAATAEQARIGDQAGGHVLRFLHTDDFWRDYNDMKARGVRFVDEPREEPYEPVIVLLDLYGDRWYLVQRIPCPGEHYEDRGTENFGR